MIWPAGGACLTAVLIATGLSGAAPEPTRVHRMTVGGRERTYRLHRPSRATPPAGFPVVLVFHGGGGNARQIERETRFSDVAEREGFVAIYPQGVGDQWNDERPVPGSRAHDEHVDDVAFIAALLDTVARSLTIDSARVFATGISNGAFMSNLLGERLAGRLAAIAPVAGGIGDRVAAGFHAEPGTSVLVLQGTDDPLVPYAGGGVLRGRRGSTVSSDSVVRLWLKANRLGGAPVVSQLANSDPSDGCRVESERWTGGARGTEVVRYRFIGGGHTWPGGTQYLPRRLVGVVCRDIEGTEEIWRFFREHPRRP